MVLVRLGPSYCLDQHCQFDVLALHISVRCMSLGRGAVSGDYVRDWASRRVAYGWGCKLILKGGVSSESLTSARDLRRMLRTCYFDPKFGQIMRHKWEVQPHAQTSLNVPSASLKGLNSANLANKGPFGKWMLRETWMVSDVRCTSPTWWEAEQRSAPASTSLTYVGSFSQQKTVDAKLCSLDDVAKCVGLSPNYRWKDCLPKPIFEVRHKGSRWCELGLIFISLCYSRHLNICWLFRL